MFSASIEKYESLIRFINSELDGLEFEDSIKGRIAGACYDMAMEHQAAILVLVANNLHGSAFALLRLIFEAYIRGAWVQRCANETQLKSFQKGDVPKFYRLVSDVEAVMCSENNTFSNAKKAFWSQMNAYTHTGMDQIVRRQTKSSIQSNYDTEEVIHALSMANVFGCLAAIDTCIMCNNIDKGALILSRMKDTFGEIVHTDSTPDNAGTGTGRDEV